MEKLLVMNVAAQLTQAACGGANVPISADLSDPNVRAKNLQVWETFRVFYRGLSSALADAANWPGPEVDAGRLVPRLLETLTPLLQKTGLAEVLQRLIAAIPVPAPAPRGPLPDPGTPASPSGKLTISN